MESQQISAEDFIKTIQFKKIDGWKQLQKEKNAYTAGKRSKPFTNVELIEAYDNLLQKGIIKENYDLKRVLRKRSVRSHSGIANITVITKGFPCPGKCIFCPTEPKMPKSYLSNEPAVMRAILNGFDAFEQTRNRLVSLNKTGHHTDKIDVIVSGGTWSFYPKRYQTSFTKGIYDALNYPQKKGKTLEESQKINENAANRCIGLSFETRPDHINEKELKRLRWLGCTKIEIGVQSLNDRILDLNKRGHGIAETKNAIKLIRDAAYKINCHMMPNLYGSNPRQDYEDMVELFENPAYRPDWLKIYPCVVVPWSMLKYKYEAGEHLPYSDEELIKLMIKVKPLVPEYCRITRLIRDIPATTIIGGSKVSNLRQFIHAEMAKEGKKCKCIRCRQVKDEKVLLSDVEMRVKEFEASEGREFFISFDRIKDDKLCSLLRLRFSSYSLNGKKHFIPELEGAALIREVHTYGEQVKVDSKTAGASQHIGLGRQMMQKAEEISRKNGFKKVAVISGIGVREYYRKLGYRLEGTYMVKDIN
ncbi:tRNA uridine(34) 5-carboxymethylaminomethyl modification radical SAM/GNAT enzyme Elp3 [Candidatus Peregrinibacteria bacterium]|nr:tRNA uridine(34) 5-carboxymethylaminomethyl modification radical SAM/GNAT enzyme Elp3 [Candidatus Peregrinibacteria bacterium]